MARHPRRRHDDAVTEPVLDETQRAFLQEARRLVLVTIAPTGLPRPVPVCFALAPPPLDVLYTPLDGKPKRADDPHDLARVRDVIARPRVALLADHWDEDWSRLAWLRLEGDARLLEPGAADAAEHNAAATALRERYPQYAGHDLEGRLIIRVSIRRTSGWGSLAI